METHFPLSHNLLILKWWPTPGFNIFRSQSQENPKWIAPKSVHFSRSIFVSVLSKDFIPKQNILAANKANNILSARNKNRNWLRHMRFTSMTPEPLMLPSLTLWWQTLLWMQRHAVVAVFPSVRVSRVPKTWKFVCWQEGTWVPVHSTLLGVTISTALRLTGRRVRQWYLKRGRKAQHISSKV